MNTHRKFEVIFVLLLVGLFIAACAPATAPTPAATSAPPPAQASATPPPAQPTAVPPQPTAVPVTVKQELIVAAPRDTYVISPTERATLGMYPTNTGIYESLVRVTPDYQLEPGLALAWEFVEPNTWRFKLREGVTFHDGQKFTAEAVKYTMARLAKAGGGSAGLGPDSVKIIDDYTVEITPKRPNRRVPQQLTHPNWSIIAPGSDPAKLPVGTGRYKIVEYVKDDHISVERNPNYWGTPGKLDKVLFRFIADENSRILALKAGEVDLVIDAPRETTEDVKNTAGLKLATSAVGAYEAFYTNAHGKAPHDIGTDPIVREAIAMAIDKTAIVKDVWRGNAEVNSSMIPVRILGSSANVVKGSAFDVEGAKKLLEGAGWKDTDGDGIREKDGRKLSLVMVVGFPTPEIHRPMPEIVQAALKDIGIDVTIDITPDTASYSARLQAGTGDLWVELGNQNDANPCFLPDLLFYSKAPPGGEPGDYAKLFAPGEKFDAFIEGCRTATTVEDVQKNAAGAMQVIIDEFHSVVPVAGVFRIYALKDTVQGFEAHPSRTNQTWENVSITGK